MSIWFHTSTKTRPLAVYPNSQSPVYIFNETMPFGLRYLSSFMNHKSVSSAHCLNINGLLLESGSPPKTSRFFGSKLFLGGRSKTLRP